MAKGSSGPEEDAEDLYEDAPCGYLSYLASDGTITRANRTLTRWTGFSNEALVGVMRFRDLLSAPARIVHEARHAVLLRTRGATEPMALEMVCSDGERLPVLVNSAIKADLAGGPDLVRVTVFDATAYRRYERHLVDARQRAEQAEGEAQRARAAAEAANHGKSRFLAAMNHEFRTPINVITGFSDLLLDKVLGEVGVEQSEYLGQIRTSAWHLLELLEDATRYARLDEIERNLARRSIGLGELMEAGLRLSRRTLDVAGVSIELHKAGEDPRISADPVSVAEAVGCLLREFARRASRGSTVQVITCSTPNGGAIRLVCRTLMLSSEALRGLSAPPDMPEINNRGLEGSGLGVAVAERVARLHSGSLRIGRSQEGGLEMTMQMGR